MHIRCPRLFSGLLKLCANQKLAPTASKTFGYSSRTHHPVRHYVTRFATRLLPGLLRRCVQLRPGLALLPAFSLFGASAPPEESFSEERKRLLAETIAKADALYDEYLIELTYQLLLDYKDGDEPELLWRLARATCDMAKNSRVAKEKQDYMTEAFGYIKRALDLNAHNWAVNKWYAILLDYVSEYKGTKERLTQAPVVKQHLMTAVAINPNDATTWHILGVWCFSFADLSWIESKVANALFATPPKSSYEEALEHFLKAEEMSPGFYSKNLLYLAKTYARLGQKEKSKDYLQQTTAYIVVSADDIAAHQEAEKLLR